MPEENKLMERSIPGMNRRERFVEAEHPRTPGQPSGGLSAILQGRRRWRVTRRGQDPSLQGHGDFVARQRRGVSDIHSPYCPMSIATAKSICKITFATELYGLCSAIERNFLQKNKKSGHSCPENG